MTSSSDLRQLSLSLLKRINDPAEESDIPQILDAHPHCVYIKDGDGRILHANAEYNARFIGQSTAIGRHGSDFLQKDLATASLCSDKLMAASCSFLQFEHLGVVWDQTRSKRVMADLRTVKMRIRQVLNPSLSILGITAIHREQATEEQRRLRNLDFYLNEIEHMDTSMQKCIALLGSGAPAAKIAEELLVSRRAIEKWRTEILHRLKLENVIELGQLLCRLQDAGLSDFGIYPIDH